MTDKEMWEDDLKFIEILRTENEALKSQNANYKEIIAKAVNDLNIIIDIVRQKPLGSDCWILDRLEANKGILEDKEV